MRASDLPSYNDLPVEPRSGCKATWGLFDRDGVKDELGTINILTPEVVAEAAKEIQTGCSVSLNWGLEHMEKPFGARKPLEHRILDWRKKDGFTFYSYDDEVNINTQTSSQWDGLRHWGHMKTGLYYNGTHHDDLIQSIHLGIDHLSKRGGIVGRGVLLDYLSWAEETGKSTEQTGGYGISISDLQAIAGHQGVTFKHGDILIVRFGFVPWYEKNEEEGMDKLMANGKGLLGVKGSEELLAWLWDNHFAAVAGDSLGFEAWPPDPGYTMHDHLLSLWGMPIGELWDLEALSKECRRQKRWSFFLTSAPLNIKGGVASPPNAIAVF